MFFFNNKYSSSKDNFLCVSLIQFCRHHLQRQGENIHRVPQRTPFFRVVLSEIYRQPSSETRKTPPNGYLFLIKPVLLRTPCLRTVLPESYRQQSVEGLGRPSQMGVSMPWIQIVIYHKDNLLDETRLSTSAF